MDLVSCANMVVLTLIIVRWTFLSTKNQGIFFRSYMLYVCGSEFIRLRKTKKRHVEGNSAETWTSPSLITLQKPHQKPKKQQEMFPQKRRYSPEIEHGT